MLEHARIAVVVLGGDDDQAIGAHASSPKTRVFDASPASVDDERKLRTSMSSVATSSRL